MHSCQTDAGDSAGTGLGENLPFQKKWWAAQVVVWAGLTAFLLVSASGILGRGPLAHARAQFSGGDLTVQYERVMRFQTSSELQVEARGEAVSQGKLDVWVGKELTEDFDAQRVIPEPAVSRLDEDGITYGFVATNHSAKVRFDLKPKVLGLRRIRIKGRDPSVMSLTVLVVP